MVTFLRDLLSSLSSLKCCSKLLLPSLSLFCSPFSFPYPYLLLLFFSSRPLAAIPINVLSTLLRLCFPCCRNKEDEPKVHTFIDPGAVSLSDPADAERRRQRALRVVDTRIAQLASTSSSPSPTGSSPTGDSPPTLPSAATIETV
jgi:hypothetical protein